MDVIEHICADLQSIVFGDTTYNIGSLEVRGKSLYCVLPGHQTSDT
jgi:hypothetical protein